MSETLPDVEEEILEEETSVELPRWIDALVVPAVNVAVALFISAAIILLLGENPFAALLYLIRGAIGYQEALGYTLFYATSFVFTGLAVAMAFHCGLLNLGAEGQAYIGGLGVALVCLGADSLPPAAILVLAVAGGALFGALWGAVPGYLQGARGSHIVITGIMFNFLAAAIMSYVLLNLLAEPGRASAETREFSVAAQLPLIHDVLRAYGYSFAESPLNISIILALTCCVLVWLLIRHTALGYEIRVVGKDHLAAVYAGISPTRAIMLAMAISGGLAGLLGVNELMGSQHRLTLNFVGGYGFVGVAVALMGGSHPFGILLSALLFGALYQGGAELSFEMPGIPREMIVLIQGLVILFSGALSHVFRPHVAALWYRRDQARAAWQWHREKMRAARDRRRAVAAGRAAAARHRASAPSPQPAPPPQPVLGTAESIDRVRERGVAAYLEHLRKIGQLREEAPAPARPRRRHWLPRLPKLPKLPKIRLTVERRHED